jgi:serine/threonine-protein kinase ATR
LKSLASSVFAKVIRHPDFTQSNKARITAMISLWRILNHTIDPAVWDLEDSSLGQWCAQSLNSSVRELRLSAGEALACFLGGKMEEFIDADLLRRNRVNALGVLKALTDRNESHLHEACIMTWRRIGCVVPDEELNLVLVKLVDYLGHDSEAVPPLAENEIKSLAEARGISPQQLFAPFWKNLAFSIVKDIVTRPQTAERVAHLVEKSVPELLALLQTFALPWLVLSKRRDVAERIAEARGDNHVWETCLYGPNLAAILSVLLIQDVPDIQDDVLLRLRHISPHFDDMDLEELLSLEPMLTALELFRISAEGDERFKSRVSCKPRSYSGTHQLILLTRFVAH